MEKENNLGGAALNALTNGAHRKVERKQTIQEVIYSTYAKKIDSITEAALELVGQQPNMNRQAFGLTVNSSFMGVWVVNITTINGEYFWHLTSYMVIRANSRTKPHATWTRKEKAMVRHVAEGILLHCGQWLPTHSMKENTRISIKRCTQDEIDIIEIALKSSDKMSDEKEEPEKIND